MMDRKEFWQKFKNGEKNFSGLDLSNSSLYGFDLTGIILVEANLTGCDFVETKFYNANLEGACFKGADLDGAGFRNCNLRRANFDSSILVRASFSDCNGDEAVFTNIDETAMAGFHDSSFKRSRWGGTAISTECVMSNIDLTDATRCPVHCIWNFSNIVLPNGEVTENFEER